MQASVEDSGASAQEPSSPREPAPTSVDDEVNMEMEVEGSVKSQAEQAEADDGNESNWERRQETCYPR